jgi:hypothetical protein
VIPTDPGPSPEAGVPCLEKLIGLGRGMIDKREREGEIGVSLSLSGRISANSGAYRRDYYLSKFDRLYMRLL